MSNHETCKSFQVLLKDITFGLCSWPYCAWTLAIFGASIKDVKLPSFSYIGQGMCSNQRLSRFVGAYKCHLFSFLETYFPSCSSLRFCWATPPEGSVTPTTTKLTFHVKLGPSDSLSTNMNLYWMCLEENPKSSVLVFLKLESGVPKIYLGFPKVPLLWRIRRCHQKYLDIRVIFSLKALS
jgi:hypothetical protein